MKMLKHIAVASISLLLVGSAFAASHENSSRGAQQTAASSKKACHYKKKCMKNKSGKKACKKVKVCPKAKAKVASNSDNAAQDE